MTLREHIEAELPNSLDSHQRLHVVVCMLRTMEEEVCAIYRPNRRNHLQPTALGKKVLANKAERDKISGNSARIRLRLNGRFISKKPAHSEIVRETRTA